MPRSKKDVKRVLLKKGFILLPGRDHEYFYVYKDGKKTAVNTKISRGSQKDISDGLLKAMMKEIRLNRDDFERYFNCTMSREEYLTFLAENCYIDK